MRIIPLHSILLPPINVGDEKLYYDTPGSIPKLGIIVGYIKHPDNFILYEFAYRGENNDIYVIAEKHQFKNP